MSQNEKIRLMLLLFAQQFKRGARKLREEGSLHGYEIMRAKGEAYHHAARLAKVLEEWKEFPWV